MKKIFALLLALMMVFALVACGDNGDNPGTSQGGQENPGTSQGNKEKEWPQNKLTDLIPAPTDVTISNLREDDTDTQYIYTVTLKDWTLEAAEAYVEQVKEAGFNLEIDADFSYDSIRKRNRFEADNSDGIVCEITFNPETNGGQIRMMEWK